MRKIHYLVLLFMLVACGNSNEKHFSDINEENQRDTQVSGNIGTRYGYYVDHSTNNPQYFYLYNEDGKICIIAMLKVNEALTYNIPIENIEEDYLFTFSKTEKTENDIIDEKNVFNTGNIVFTEIENINDRPKYQAIYRVTSLLDYSDNSDQELFIVHEDGFLGQVVIGSFLKLSQTTTNIPLFEKFQFIVNSNTRN